MISKKNGEQIFEYKFPGFIKENNFVGNTPDDFEVLQDIGGGGFSKVLKVKSKNTLGIYAMKKVDMRKILIEQRLKQKYFENEVIILKKLNNSNVCRCYNIFQCENFLYFIMEFMNNGDLNSFYEANKSLDINIPEDKLWDIFYKCLRGLNYIHKQGLIHRDIKLQNLFLDDDLNIKIGDFNVSVAVNEKFAKNFGEGEKEKITNMINNCTRVGSGGYEAPEVKNESYCQKIDIYSMGIVFFELCYKCNPYENIKGKDSYYEQNIYSKELNNLVDKMIQKNEDDRIDSNQALNIAKKYFIKKFVKNTSVEAVLKCFYNFPNFKEYFCNNNTMFFLTENKREIGTNVFNVIQAIKENKEENIEDSLYELRNCLTNEGLNIKKENLEIDPGQFISFLIRKLNSDLNEVTAKQNNNNYISSYNTFYPGREEEAFNNQIYIYNLRLSSIISKNFFNILKTKKVCNVCGNIELSYSMLHFIPFNADLFAKKCSSLTVEDAFDCLSEDQITLGEKKKIKCGRCKNFTPHTESKIFYHTAKNLIIVFDRGEKYQNDMFIDFFEQLELKKTEVERYNQVKYHLLGIISRIENKDKNEEFISFINKGNNQWVSDKNNEKIMNLEDVKKQGIVLCLFYYCNDNNMILQTQNMTNFNIQQNNNQEFNNNFRRINSENPNQGNFMINSRETNINNNPMINSMPQISCYNGGNNNNNFMNYSNNNVMINNRPGLINNSNININNNNTFYPMGNMNNSNNNVQQLFLNNMNPYYQKTNIYY